MCNCLSFKMVHWKLTALTESIVASFQNKIPSLEQGARVGITGSIAKDEWTDRATGEPRSRHKVQVKHLDILESKAEAELRRGNSGRSYGGGGSSYGSGNNYDDDGGPEPAGTGGFFD